MSVLTKETAPDPRQWPNMLVRTDDWFTGPDGLSYQYFWGPVCIAPTEAALGFEAKANANYFFMIGTPGCQLILAGCRVHYLLMCPSRPKVMQHVLDMTDLAARTENFFAQP